MQEIYSDDNIHIEKDDKVGYNVVFARREKYSASSVKFRMTVTKKDHYIARLVTMQRRWVYHRINTWPAKPSGESDPSRPWGAVRRSKFKYFLDLFSFVFRYLKIDQSNFLELYILFM